MKGRLFQSTVRRGGGGKHERVHQQASQWMNEQAIASIGNFLAVKRLFMHDRVVLIACYCSFSCNCSESHMDRSMKMDFLGQLETFAKNSYFCWAQMSSPALQHGCFLGYWLDEEAAVTIVAAQREVVNRKPSTLASFGSYCSPFQVWLQTTPHQSVLKNLISIALQNLYRAKFSFLIVFVAF